jgi:hypothetical protein
VEPTTDIFTLFRDLNVFKRNKKRFELKVVAVLLYAFGHSEKPLDSSGFSPSLFSSRAFRIG